MDENGLPKQYQRWDRSKFLEPVLLPARVRVNGRRVELSEREKEWKGNAAYI
jgi:hypothetical protein